MLSNQKNVQKIAPDAKASLGVRCWRQAAQHWKELKCSLHTFACVQQSNRLFETSSFNNGLDSYIMGVMKEKMAISSAA